MTTVRVPVLEDFSWQPPVEDKDLTTSPSGGGVLKGMRYIVATNGGDWAGGAAKDIATCKVTDPQSGADWMFDTPTEGWQCWVKDEDAYYVFDGTNWAIEDVSSLEADVTSIDTRVSNTESSVGSIDTRVSVNESTNVVQSTGISTNVGAIASNALVGDSNASSIVSINTRATNIESSVGSIDTRCDANESDISTNSEAISNANSSIASINTAKQDKGTYVSEYGAIEFTV